MRHWFVYVQFIITTFAKVQIAVKTEHIMRATGLILLLCVLIIVGSGINGFGISV